MCGEHLDSQATVELPDGWSVGIQYLG